MASDTQLVQQLYRGFNARDIDAVLSLLADDTTWANGMEGGYVHDREAIRAYWMQQWVTISPHVEPMQVGHTEDGSMIVEVHQVVHDLKVPSCSMRRSVTYSALKAAR
jgi:ketosteroid isomerase-like protein